MTRIFERPRGVADRDSAALEQRLGEHGRELDPTVFMAGVRRPAVQVRRTGVAWQDGEAGLLILPGAVVEYGGERIPIAVQPAAITAPIP